MASNVTEFFEMEESRSAEIGTKMSEGSAAFLHPLEPSSKLSGTNVSDYKGVNENLRLKTKLKNIQCIPSGCSANIGSFKKFLERNKKTCKQKFTFSVLSDNECDTGIEPNESAQSIRKMVCSSLVEAAALANSWIITGGLNNGVHQLIENEVQQRLGDEDIVPTFLLEMRNRECLVTNLRNSRKMLPVILDIQLPFRVSDCSSAGLAKDSFSRDGEDSDSNTANLWLNQNKNHIPFLLVDDDAPGNTGSICSFREKVEEALSEEQPLIYVLIGGGLNAIDYVKSALTKHHHVIIAMGTGGAADIISESGSCIDGAILEYLPKVAENLFKCLEDLRIGERNPASVVQQAIAKIKTESNLELLFEIVKLLGKTEIGDGGAQPFKEEIAALGYTTTKELLVGIKDYLTSKQTSSDNSIQSATDSEYNTVMRGIFQQMLVVNEVPLENAARAVNGLENESISETLANVRRVTTDLKAIRTHAQKHRVIQFDITSREKKTIFSLINEAPRKGHISGSDRKCDTCGQYHTNADSKMCETKFKRKDEDKIDVVNFIERTFKKRECNRFKSETSQPAFCQCGYSRSSHSEDALHNESNQSGPSTKTSRTDAFGKLSCVEDEEKYVDWKKKSNDIRYVRLDHRQDVSKVSDFLFDLWELGPPDIILSVLSDSDFDQAAGKGLEVHVLAMKRNEPIENIRKMICNSIVDAAAETNAWIISGGLNKGVDQLIGNEVKQRMVDGDKIPKALLGISNWGCLENKRSLLNVSSGSDCSKPDVTSSGTWLNQHHTHFLLVDDGTQKKSGCENILREKVELALMRWDTSNYFSEEDFTRIPLIYILIGGSFNSFRFVERALANGVPVIVAMGTGGAADTISEGLTAQSGLTLENVPEIFEELFNRLCQLLIKVGSSENEARQVIDNIKGNTALELFLKIVELLNKPRNSSEDTQHFRSDIANLKKGTLEELLTEIKNLIISEEPPSDQCNHSSLISESDAVNRMRDVIEQMLVVNRISKERAKQAVDAIDEAVLTKALNKTLVLVADLGAVQEHECLIKLNKNMQMETGIVEALKKVKRKEPTAPYSLCAAWENETFFKQLLLDNWMQHEHENVLKQLLKWSPRANQWKYVELLMEHVGNYNWVTKVIGSENIHYKGRNMHKELLEKLNEDTNNSRFSIVGKKTAKKAFIWCVQKHMPEMAMRFWIQGEDCLAMAVLAYSLSKEQKDCEFGKTKLEKSNTHTEEDIVRVVDYAEKVRQQKFFEKVALDFVRQCHLDDTDNTFRLLSHKVEDLDDQTPLLIALNARFGKFFYSDLLTAIWSEKIANYRELSYKRLIASVAFPMLAPEFLQIQTDADDYEKLPIGSKRYWYEFTTFLQSPLAKFHYWFISYIFYLMLFSFVMLTNFRAKMSSWEIILSIWTSILLIEEVKQLNDDTNVYMSNKWNYFDIGALLLYVIGFTLRMIYHVDPTIHPEFLNWARIALAFSLLIFFCRTLQFLSNYESLGPKIYMIYGLVSDLYGFMLILIVFISAYGVVSNVILYPNQPLSVALLKDVFYDAWWSVLQEFNRDDASGLNCKTDNDSALITAEYCSGTFDDSIDYARCKENRCPANTWIVSVLLSFYVLLMCIMLLNVLIAMFNSTYAAIDEKEKEVSNIQRYRLISEFRCHSVIPPPLCVFTYPYHIWNFFKRCESSHRKSSANNNCCTTDVEGGHNGEESRPALSAARIRKIKRISEMKSWENVMATRYYKETMKRNNETRNVPEMPDAIYPGEKKKE